MSHKPSREDILLQKLNPETLEIKEQPESLAEQIALQLVRRKKIMERVQEEKERALRK